MKKKESCCPEVDYIVNGLEVLGHAAWLTISSIVTALGRLLYLLWKSATTKGQ